MATALPPVHPRRVHLAGFRQRRDDGLHLTRARGPGRVAGPRWGSAAPLTSICGGRPTVPVLAVAGAADSHRAGGRTRVAALPAHAAATRRCGRRAACSAPTITAAGAHGRGPHLADAGRVAATPTSARAGPGRRPTRKREPAGSARAAQPERVEAAAAAAGPAGWARRSGGRPRGRPGGSARRSRLLRGAATGATRTLLALLGPAPRLARRARPPGMPGMPPMPAICFIIFCASKKRSTRSLTSVTVTPGALGDAQPARAVEDLGRAPLLRRHRPDDRGDPVEVAVVDLADGLLHLPHAGQHPEQARRSSPSS